MSCSLNSMGGLLYGLLKIEQFRNEVGFDLPHDYAEFLQRPDGEKVSSALHVHAGSLEQRALLASSEQISEMIVHEAA